MVEKPSQWNVLLIAQGFCGKRVSVLLSSVEQDFWAFLIWRYSNTEFLKQSKHWSPRPPNPPPTPTQHTYNKDLSVIWTHLFGYRTRAQQAFAIEFLRCTLRCLDCILEVHIFFGKERSWVAPLYYMENLWILVLQRLISSYRLWPLSRLRAYL